MGCASAGPAATSVAAFVVRTRFVCATLMMSLLDKSTKILALSGSGNAASHIVRRVDDGRWNA